MFRLCIIYLFLNYYPVSPWNKPLTVKHFSLLSVVSRCFILCIRIVMIIVLPLEHSLFIYLFQNNDNFNNCIRTREANLPDKFLKHHISMALPPEERQPHLRIRQFSLTRWIAQGRQNGGGKWCSWSNWLYGASFYILCGSYFHWRTARKMLVGVLGTDPGIAKVIVILHCCLSLTGII